MKPLELPMVKSPVQDTDISLLCHAVFIWLNYSQQVISTITQ